MGQTARRTMSRKEWPDKETLERNRLDLVAELTAQIDGFEKRMGKSSEQLVDEVAFGKAEETAGVAEWLIALRTLRALTSAT